MSSDPRESFLAPFALDLRKKWTRDVLSFLDQVATRGIFEVSSRAASLARRARACAEAEDSAARTAGEPLELVRCKALVEELLEIEAREDRRDEDERDMERVLSELRALVKRPDGAHAVTA